MTGQIPTVDDSRDLFSSIALIMSHEYLKRAKTLLAAQGGPLADFILRMIDPNPTGRPQDYPVLIAALEGI
jgi:hypothetical protein